MRKSFAPNQNDNMNKTKYIWVRMKRAKQAIGSNREMLAWLRITRNSTENIEMGMKRFLCSLYCQQICAMLVVIMAEPFFCNPSYICMMRWEWMRDFCDIFKCLRLLKWKLWYNEGFVELFYHFLIQIPFQGNEKISIHDLVEIRY